MDHGHQGKRWWAATRAAAAALVAGGALAGCGAGGGETTGTLVHDISGGMTDLSHHHVFLLIAFH